MAAFNTILSCRAGRWPSLLGCLATSLLLLAGVPAGADDRSVYIIDDQEPQESVAYDIAAALKFVEDETVEEQLVEPAAYAEPATGDPGAGQGGADLPPEPPAEEIAATEEIDELSQLEGPPKWDRILRPITEVTANATLPAGLLPSQVKHEGDAPRAEMMPEVGDPRLVGGWGGNVFNWSAAKSWHHPLYFEEVNLERYGYQCHPVAQPFVSGAHFFLTIPTLPYQMTASPPRECIYTLGHYRPGSCVPWRRNHLPWDPRAAAVEAGVVVGLVFLIP